MSEVSPRITLRDPLGVELGVIGSGALLDFFSGFQEFLLGVQEGTLLELLRDPAKLLSDIELDEVSAGLHFDEKLAFLELGDQLLEYFVDAGTQGKLILSRPGTRFDGREVPEGRVYSTLELSAFLDLGASVPIPLGSGVTVSPGLRGETSFEISHRRPHPESRPVLDILKEAIGELRFPFNPESVAGLAEGEEISLRWDGTLAWSVAVSWGISAGLLIDDPKDLDKLDPDLQRAKLLGTDVDLGVPLAAQARVEVVHGVTDEFEFQVRGTGSNRVQVEVRKAESKFSDVGFGFTAGLVQGAVPGLRRELDQFLTDRFGLSEQPLDLVSRLVDAAEEALAKRARSEFSSLYAAVDRGEALFRLEFDLGSAAARQAYRGAVEGDLTIALRMAEEGDPAVTVASTVHEALRRESLLVHFNLIGFFKFDSWRELARKSIVEVDQQGEVSIYHGHSFKARSRTSLGHLQVADFLFKATWMRGHQDPEVERDFEFSLRYGFSEEDRFTSRAELVESLGVAVLLGLISEARKQEILHVPVKFRRALSWPVLDVFSPEATYGKTRIAVRSTFDEAALASILEQDETAVWAAFIRAYPVARPRSQATDWLDPAVRAKIDREGWAAYVKTSDDALRRHRHAVLAEYAKARQFVKTLRVFRKAVDSKATGEELIERMGAAGKAARAFHFDQTAFLALNLLCDSGQRQTEMLIAGDKINGTFPGRAVVAEGDQT